MKNNIHFFSEKDPIKKSEIMERIGQRGREAADFSQFDLPILPGFIIDADVADTLDSQDIIPVLKSNVKKIEKITGKEFNTKIIPCFSRLLSVQT